MALPEPIGNDDGEVIVSLSQSGCCRVCIKSYVWVFWYRCLVRSVATFMCRVMCPLESVYRSMDMCGYRRGIRGWG